MSVKINEHRIAAGIYCILQQPYMENEMSESINKKYTYQELSAFCLQISMLLNAAVPLDEGLSIMSQDSNDAAEKKLLLSMAEGAELGIPLFQLM